MGNANDEGQTTVDDNTDDKTTDVDNNNVVGECDKPSVNPYFNFLQVFRKQNKETKCKPSEMTRKGAAVWNSMSTEEKKPYQDMADKVKAQCGVKRKRAEDKKQKKPSKRRKVDYSSSRSSTHYSTTGETDSRSYVSARTSYSFDSGTACSYYSS